MIYVLRITTQRNLDLSIPLGPELQKVLAHALRPNEHKTSQALAEFWIDAGIESAVFPSATGSGRNVVVYLSNSAVDSVICTIGQQSWRRSCDQNPELASYLTQQLLPHFSFAIPRHIDRTLLHHVRQISRNAHGAIDGGVQIFNGNRILDGTAGALFRGLAV
jgi:hypothetical protein